MKKCLKDSNKRDKSAVKTKRTRLLRHYGPMMQFYLNHNNNSGHATVGLFDVTSVGDTEEALHAYVSRIDIIEQD